jgi:hypothetical protein
LIIIPSRIREIYSQGESYFEGYVITPRPVLRSNSEMPRYLISFDNGSMYHIAEFGMPEVSRASHKADRDDETNSPRRYSRYI